MTSARPRDFGVAFKGRVFWVEKNDPKKNGPEKMEGLCNLNDDLTEKTMLKRTNSDSGSIPFNRRLKAVMIPLQVREQQGHAFWCSMISNSASCQNHGEYPIP